MSQLAFKKFCFWKGCVGRTCWPVGSKRLKEYTSIWNDIDCLAKLTKLTFASEYVDLRSSSMDCFMSVRLLKKNDAGITGIYEIKTQK